MDKIGPIARSATDCAIVFEAIAGLDPADPSTLDSLTSRHEQLAQELGLPFPGPIETELADLGRLFQGAALLGEMSPRLQARALLLQRRWWTLRRVPRRRGQAGRDAVLGRCRRGLRRL